MIQEILEKHMDDFTGTILFESFPALAAAIESLVREEAITFADWAVKGNYSVKLFKGQDGPNYFTAEELFDLYKSKTKSNDTRDIG